jgi:hypothetical protein
MRGALYDAPSIYFLDAALASASRGAMVRRRAQRRQHHRCSSGF